MLSLFPKYLRSQAAHVRAHVNYRGFAPAAGSGFNDVIHNALAAGGLADEAAGVIEKLSAAKVKDVKVASKLSDADWSSIGVNVGERIVIQDAIEKHLANTPKLPRTGSRGGKLDTHQRSL